MELFDKVKEAAAGVVDFTNEHRTLMSAPALGIPSKLIDSTMGTNISKVEDRFFNSFGDSLVDGTVNGIMYLGGLAQGGLEKAIVIKDLPQVDQVVPKLDLYEDLDTEKASTAENIAGRAGQIASYFVPIGGEGKASMKALNIAVKLGRLGQNLEEFNNTDYNEYLDLVL